MISVAHAASAAGAPFYADTSFWTAMAFVIFFAFFGKKMWVIITGMLDERAERIRTELDEAAKLREEAQDLLAAYQKKQRDAQDEAKAIVEHAREEAKRIATEAEAGLEAGLKRREQLAMDRIAQAETKALDEVRTMAVDVAVEATRTLLAEKVSDAQGDKLVDDAIKGLAGKLH